MKLWCQYIGERKTVLLTLAVFAGIFAVVFAIYDLPVQAVFYPALVCAFLGSILAVVRFSAWKRRHQLLSALQGEVTETVEGLPLAGSWLERDYQALLRAVHQQKDALTGQMEKQYRDCLLYTSRCV